MTSFFQKLLGAKPKPAAPPPPKADPPLPAAASPIEKKETMPKLYDFELSGSCYKIRLLASILGVTLDKQNVDFVKKEHKSETYTALNPFGEIPIFEDGDFRLRDAQAILTYFAGTYDPARTWWPTDARSQG